MPPGAWRFCIQQPITARAHMTRSARAHGGLTLIETLATVGLLTVVVLTCSSLITDGLVSTRMTRWDNLARAAALAEIERLKALPFDGAPGNDIVSLPADALLTQPDGDPANGIPANGIADNLEDIPGAVGRVYVANYNYDLDGSGPYTPATSGTVKQITVSVSVYGSQNILGSPGPPPVGSLRSVWRISTVVSKK